MNPMVKNIKCIGNYKRIWNLYPYHKYDMIYRSNKINLILLGNFKRNVARLALITKQRYGNLDLRPTGIVDHWSTKTTN